MSLLTQQDTKSNKVKPKVEPIAQRLVRVPSTQFYVDVETGLVYLNPEQLKALTQGLS